jgi:hypothetical protein
MIFSMIFLRDRALFTFGDGQVHGYFFLPTIFMSIHPIFQKKFMPDNDICFVLDQHTEFDFYSTNSLKQQSAGNYRNDAPLKTY